MEPFDNLTEKQLAVYEFIRDKIRNRGYGPTVREIGEQFRHQLTQRRGVPSEGPGEERLITREPNMSRAIQLAAEPIDERSLPLYGQIAAGVLARGGRAGRAGRFRDALRSGRQEPLRAGGPRRIDDRGPDCRRRLRGRPPPADRAERPDRRGHYRRRRGHAEALVSRKRTASAWSPPIRP